MRDKVNGVLANTLGYAYLGIICVVAIAAVPLMFITHGGQLT
jgi:hypothetical protein